MNILEALEASPTPSGTRRCRIGRWLDDIADDTPGKDALAATLSTTDQASPDWRRIDQLDALLTRLGLVTSSKTIGDHRGGRCRCAQ